MTTATETASNTITNSTRGAIKRWSETFIPTTRDAPSDAKTPSHVYMVRAGLIRLVAAGVYNYLPLAWRSLMKVSSITRGEMEAAGASEMLLPTIAPMELFAASKRDEDYGDLLFRFEDRHGRAAALGPTHEEVITDLMKSAISSYKHLPLTLYQIQTKFRDEFRPRAGLLRGREFIMKDAYSFHTSVEGEGGLNEAYDAQYRAYSRVFERCGLDFTVVEAESGPIGGSASHEFMVNAPTGEDTILRCAQSGYAANVEKCEIGARDWSFDGDGSDSSAIEKVHTPRMPGIELVADHLGVAARDMLKTIVFKVSETGWDTERPAKWIVACVRGDHEVNEGKVRDASGHKVELAPEGEARSAGFAVGFVSPTSVNRLKDLDVEVLIDPDATRGVWVTGADEADYHVKGWSWNRDFAIGADSVIIDDALRGSGVNSDGKIKVVDLRNALAGDPSPRAEGSKLEEQRGIEVGHIFKLGTKYSSAMGFEVMNEQQKREPVIMGCYGLGVSRTLAAAIEQNHDENGIVWPVPIAPYHVHIVVMKPGDERQEAACADISERLAAEGVDVLIDDRAERPGVKFKDADLVGLPIRLTLGDKALDQDSVEFKLRREEGKGDLAPLTGVVERCVTVLNG